MKIQLRFFGSLREEAGASSQTFRVESGARVSELRILLAAKYPTFDRLGERMRVSVNMEFVEGDPALSEGDEVAFLPPVAGGAGKSLCSLSDSALAEAEVVARVSGAGMGGLVSFIGTVRDQSRGKSIQFLEYEAYPEMALREMEKICVEAAEKWPGTRVAIAHRTGRLEIGDAAVVIAAAAPHRAEAFEAARFAIDVLKVRVPIWKKEVATDGEYWVDEHA